MPNTFGVLCFYSGWLRAGFPLHGYPITIIIMTLRNDFNHLQSPVWLSYFVLTPFSSIFSPQSARLVSSSFRSVTGRPPQEERSQLTQWTSQMALATWEMVARVTRCHQMSRDVTRTWILLILLASMAWRCYDCYDCYDMLWHVTVLPRGTLGPQKPHMQWQNSEGVGVGAAGVHILSVSVSDIYIYNYIYIM